MDNLPIVGVVLAAFFSLLIVSKKTKNVHDYILLCWLLLVGIHQLYYYINFIGVFGEFQAILIVGSYFPFLYGPVLFLYAISLKKKRKFKPGFYLLHFFPFIYFSTITLIFYYINDGSYSLEVYEGDLHKSGNVPFLLNTFHLSAVSGGLYPLISLWLLQKHKNNIKNEFSYTESINLNWLKYWIICMFVCFLIIFSLIKLIELSDALRFVSLTLTLSLIVISYYGFRQTAIFVDADNIKNETSELVIDNQPITREKFEKKNNKTKYKKSGVSKEQSEKYAEILLYYMNKNKPFLDNKLSLKQLSEKLNISTNHLSQIINEYLNQNFFDFVNKYRVDEVKQKLADPKHVNFTILAIAYDCGFNSKSAFNNAFKRFTGYTPVQYKKIAVS